MDSDPMKTLRKIGAKLVSWKAVGKGRSYRVEMDDSALLDVWRQLYEGLLDEAMEEDKKVSLVALAEALKVRVISKGPVATYTVLKPLQKWMWRMLKHHKSGAFRLIGEEIGAEYLENQLGELREGESYLSGDYKSATDNLNPEISNAIVDELAEGIDDRRVRKLFKESLTGHMIEDPEKPGHFQQQKWGQLMGSITSFPILCIANAAICTLSREADLGRKLNLASAKIALNGDDCVFRATPEGRTAWEEYARASGMAPSVGKYFFSRKFLNMNSAQFLVRPTILNEENGTIRKKFLEWVPRINMGLLVGLGRSTSGKVEKASVTSWGTVNSISKNAHTLVNECAVEDRERVFKAYLNSNWKMLALKKGPKGNIIAGTRLPWFLPEALGGLGLPTFPDYIVLKDGKMTQPWMPTEIDLRLAAALARFGALPAKSPEGVTWKVWEHAQKRMRDFPTGSTVHAMYEHHSAPDPEGGLSSVGQFSMMSRLVIEALFTLPFGQVYKEGREKNQTLRRIEDAVDKVKKHMGKVEPFQADALPHHVTAKEEKVAARLTSTAYQMQLPDIFSE
jgi:hypothetical protein